MSSLNSMSVSVVDILVLRIKSFILPRAPPSIVILPFTMFSDTIANISSPLAVLLYCLTLSRSFLAFSFILTPGPSSILSIDSPNLLRKTGLARIVLNTAACKSSCDAVVVLPSSKIFFSLKNIS